MKEGDTVPVTIAGQVVAQASVKSVGEGEVTLVVPGTIVRMATRTQLAPEATAPENGATPDVSTEHQILGVDNTAVSSANTATPAAPAGTDATVVTQTGGTPEVSLPEPTAPSSDASAPVGEPAPVGTPANPASVVDLPPTGPEQVNPTVQ